MLLSQPGQNTALPGVKAPVEKGKTRRKHNTPQMTALTSSRRTAGLAQINPHSPKPAKVQRKPTEATFPVGKDSYKEGLGDEQNTTATLIARIHNGLLPLVSLDQFQKA